GAAHDRDLVALAGERQRYGAPNAPAAARDQCFLFRHAHRSPVRIVRAIDIGGNYFRIKLMGAVAMTRTSAGCEKVAADFRENPAIDGGHVANVRIKGTLA